MNLDIAIKLFNVYNSLMTTRHEDIVGALECAAIDGGFRLTYNEKYGLLAHDLHGQVKPFAVSFNGGRGKDPFADIKVVAEAEGKPSSPETSSVKADNRLRACEEGLRFG